MLKLHACDSVISLSTITFIDQFTYFHSDEHLTVFGSGEIYDINETDCALYLNNAYKRWGKRLPEHLYGSDWWFVIYDRNTHETFVAIEQHGSVCLYYTLLDNRLYISNSLGSIRNYISNSLDYSHVLATVLYGLPADTQSTCYKNVFQLSPGHTLVYKYQLLTVQKYWFPEAILTKERTPKEELYEELGSLYYQAVEKRLNKAQKPGSMLSGGLDSASVTCLAAEILSLHNKQLYTVSHVPKYKLKNTSRNWFNDESPHILSVVNQYQNIVPEFIDSADSCPIEGIEQFLGIINNVSHGARNLFWMHDLLKYLQEIGCDVCLTGKNGNYILSYSGYSPLLPVYHPYFLHNPKRIPGRLLRSFIGHNPEKLLNQSLQPSYILPEHLSFELKQKLIQQTKGSLAPVDSFQSLLAFRIACENQNHFRNYNEIYKRFGVKIKDPTADVRLLEFCLSLPNEMFFGPKGETRYLIRKIMQHRMPSTVLNEKQKGKQASDISLRLIDSKKKVNGTVEAILENTDFKSLIDVQKFQATVQSINKGIEIGELASLHFVKAIMLGLFLLNQKKGVI
jgi:asparagine synthase (glutamine-hydrolysing)